MNGLPFIKYRPAIRDTLLALPYDQVIDFPAVEFAEPKSLTGSASILNRQKGWAEFKVKSINKGLVQRVLRRSSPDVSIKI